MMKVGRRYFSPRVTKSLVAYYDFGRMQLCFAGDQQGNILLIVDGYSFFRLLIMIIIV